MSHYDHYYFIQELNNSYKELWRAVVKQALDDLIEEATDYRIKYINSNMINWVYDEKSDFKQVCQYANFEADAIKKIFTNIFITHNAKIRNKDKMIIKGQPKVASSKPQHKTKFAFKAKCKLIG